MNWLVELHRLGVREVLIVIRGRHVQHGTGVTKTNRRERFYLLGFERHQHFFDVREDASFTLRANLGLGQVVETEDEILRRNGDGLAGCRRQDVVRSEHQHGSFDLRFWAERDVHGHLITVEVGVEGGADQRMNLDGLTFDEHGLKRLDTQAMQRRCAVQQDWMVLDDLFEDVPNDGLLHAPPSLWLA